MAATLYTALSEEIKADLRVAQGRTLDATRLASAWTTAIDWFLGLHPDGWPGMWISVTSAAANETLSVQTDTGALGATFPVLPRLSPDWVVRAKVSAGTWMPLSYLPWGDVIHRKSVYNRTATTTLHQKYWSIKVDGTVTTGKKSVITLESFPRSYATNLLTYEIDYRRASPTAGGANADDAFFWPNRSHDQIPKYFAEALIAHELNDIIPGVFDRAWGLARELAARALVDSGVQRSRIKFEYFGTGRVLENV